MISTANLARSLIAGTTPRERVFLRQLRALIHAFRQDLRYESLQRLVWCAFVSSNEPPSTPLAALLRGMGLSNPDLALAKDDHPISPQCDLVLAHIQLAGADGILFGPLARFYYNEVDPTGRTSLRQVITRLVNEGTIIEHDGTLVARDRATALPDVIAGMMISYARRAGAAGVPRGNLTAYAHEALTEAGVHTIDAHDAVVVLESMGWLRARRDRLLATDAPTVLPSHDRISHVPNILATVGRVAAAVESDGDEGSLIQYTVHVEPGTSLLQSLDQRFQEWAGLVACDEEDATAANIVLAIHHPRAGKQTFPR